MAAIRLRLKVFAKHREKVVKDVLRQQKDTRNLAMLRKFDIYVHRKKLVGANRCGDEVLFCTDKNMRFIFIPSI